MSRKLLIIGSVLAAMFCVTLDSTTAEAGRFYGGYRAGYRNGYGNRAYYGWRGGWRGGWRPAYRWGGYYGPGVGYYYY